MTDTMSTDAPDSGDALLARLCAAHGGPGPRYTSYPTAADFSSQFGARQYGDALRELGRRDRPISLYVHIPFCQARCNFCACSVVSSPQHDRLAGPYVDALRQELDLVQTAMGGRPMVSRIHLGGGTPTYLAPSLLARLYADLRARAKVEQDAELSIELDPRVTTREQLEILARAGVNRISIGVQDFNETVQSEIGRHQHPEQTRNLVQNARELGIASINIDLVYGLPAQSLDTMRRTIAQVIDLDIDRIALYAYAHVPAIRSNQKQIDTQLLPDALTRLKLFMAARAQLATAGFEAVGMDHFAKSHDPLAVAAREQRLGRNFMGYTDRRADHLVGLGVTAISSFDEAFAQNTSKLSAYHKIIARGEFAIDRGIMRTKDDVICAKVITELMCQLRIDRRSIERDCMLPEFDRHFASALTAMTPLVDDGLVRDDGQYIELTDLGRLFVRRVAMCFDHRLTRRHRKLDLAVLGQRGRRPFSQTV